MSQFNDANTLDDILGCVWLAQTWGPKSDFDIHNLIAEIANRISEKIGRSKNAARSNWFSNALEQVKAAALSYEQNRCADGEEFPEGLVLATDVIDSEQVAAPRRRPHFGFAEFNVSPAAAAGELLRSAAEGFGGGSARHRTPHGRVAGRCVA